MEALQYLVPGRECGDCTACCIHLAIIEDAMNKLPGVTCQHCSVNEGCDIYEARPNVCRNYYCMWRSFDNMDEAWRPDRSGIIIVDHAVPAGYPAKSGVNLVVTDGPDVLKTDKFASMAAGFIASGTATFLDLPAGPGLLSRNSMLNEALAPAIARRDLAMVKALIWQCYEALKATPTRQITEAHMRGEDS